MDANKEKIYCDYISLYAIGDAKRWMKAIPFSSLQECKQLVQQQQQVAKQQPKRSIGENAEQGKKVV